MSRVIQRKKPALRLYTPGLGGVGLINTALDEQNQDEQKAREQGLALANVQLKIELDETMAALTGAQRQKLLRARRAQARLNAKLAVNRTKSEKETAAAIEAATEVAFEDALKQLNEEHERVGFDVQEYNEKKSALFEAFYPTKPVKDTKVPSMSQGSVMTDAPRGKGLLITGGYDSTQIGKVSGASRRDHGGIEPWHGEGANKPARPEGKSIDKDNGKVLSDGKGSYKHVEAPTPSFVVKLGDDYTLTPIQKKLETLIGKHRVLLRSLHKEHDAKAWKVDDPEARRRTIEEDTRMKLDFLSRAAAGLVPAEIADRVVPLLERDLAAVTG